MKGFLTFVLQAHLPFIRHPESDSHLEENWFFEAVIESYAPLLDVFERLTAEGVPVKIGLSISSTVGAMLEDELLGRRLARYAAARLELAERRLRDPDPRIAATSALYADRLKLALKALERGLLSGFRALEEAGAVELLTSTATHGLLPLLLSRESLRAQAEVARREHARRFGRAPRGLWLAECAIDGRVPSILKEAGFAYTFVDQHALLNGRPRPRLGTHVPARTSEGCSLFARDLDTARQIWSPTAGFPCDPVYREFYRDLGFDGDLELVRPCLEPDGVRRSIGLKYHRVTGKPDLGEKELYEPEAARRKTEAHAAAFLRDRSVQIEHLSKGLSAVPVVAALYDAELFGHWWLEGPWFLESFLRQVHAQRPDFALATPTEALAASAHPQPVEPDPSSWGDKGYFETWLNGNNDWIYPHVHAVERRMALLAGRYRGRAIEPLMERALAQCAREALLLQASDWPFLMSTGPHAAYAKARVEAHAADFTALADQAEAGTIDEGKLAALEARNNLFPGLDFRVFAPSSAG